MSRSPLQSIDLFSGCGGLSTGLHLAGWKGLFAVERNPEAFTTLKANLVDGRKHFDWPSWLPVGPWDIKTLLKKKSRQLAKLKGTVDLVVGGPPCQGFSTAGRRVEGDERNHLVHSYLGFVKLVQPRAILFENVRGFTMKFKASAEAGLTYSLLVIQELQKLGYKDAAGKLVDMSDFGVPQRRQRFIVIATREGAAGAVFSALDSQCASHLAHTASRPATGPARRFPISGAAMARFPARTPAASSPESPHGRTRACRNTSAATTAATTRTATASSAPPETPQPQVA